MYRRQNNQHDVNRTSFRVLLISGLVTIFFFPPLLRAQTYNQYQIIYPYGAHYDLEPTAPTPDSSVICCQPLDQNSFAVYKLDHHARIVWARKYSAACSDLYISAITVSNDGTIFILGNGYNNYKRISCILALDPVGAVLWCKDIVTQLSTISENISLASDGGFIITGRWGYFGCTNAGKGFILRTDRQANPLWCIEAPTLNREWDSRFYGAEECPDGTVIALTKIDNSRFITAIGTFRISATGEILSGEYYGIDSIKLYPTTISRMQNGGYLISAYTDQENKRGQQLLVAITESGEVQWSYEYVLMDNIERFSTIRQGFGNCWYAVARTYQDPIKNYVLVIDSSGQIRTVVSYKGVTDEEGIDQIYQTSSGRFIAFDENYYNHRLNQQVVRSLSPQLEGCGTRKSNAVRNPISLTKKHAIYTPDKIEISMSLLPLLSEPLSFEQQLLCETRIGATLIDPAILTITPNPAPLHSKLTVASTDIPCGYYICSIRSITGIVLYSTTLERTATTDALHLSTDNLPAGMYTIELTDVNNFGAVWHGKVVIQ